MRLLNASGCLDAATAPDVARSLDAFVTKTVTPLPREGNDPVRIAEVVLEPTYVTEVMPAGHDVLACGPAPMLEAIRALTPHAQLAWEASMACGYGACWGCAVRIDGELKRLCVEGPVLDAAA